MKYKALLLDLDDTLIKSGKVYNRAQRFAAEYLAKMYSLDIESFFEVVQEKHLIVQRNFPSVHTRHSRVLVFRMALDQFYPDYDISVLPDVEDMYWNFFLDEIELFPNVLEVLNKIKENGVKIGIVSDGSLSLRIRKLKAAGLISVIDQVIASEEVIFEKPFSAIFTLALSRLKVEATDTVMLGNNFKNDIRGAQLIGIHAGIFSPESDSNLEGQDGTITPDFTIVKYEDLYGVLGV